MKKECRAKILGSLLVGVTLLTMTLVHAPALAELSNYNPQGLKATTLEEVLALPDEEIDLATAILILSEEWDDSFDITESLEEINGMALELRVLIDNEDGPERVVSLINHYLFLNKCYAYTHDSSFEGEALPQVIKNGGGDCVGLSLLYLTLTERLELPFYGVAVPGHFFVRYDNGQKKTNIETTDNGTEWDDSEYEERFGYPTYRKYDFYLRNLSKKEVIGVFLYNLGMAYTNEGMFDEAIAGYKKAIEINSNHVETHNNLGGAYADKGMLDEAIVEYKKAIEINPDYATVYSNLGLVYTDKGMYDEAIVEYKKAIEINPRDSSAYTNLGSVYGNKLMFDKAVIEYKKAIEINPNSSNAYNNLGAVYHVKGMYDEAIVEYKKAIEINPDYAKPHYGLGSFYSKKGMYDEAIIELKKAIEINPNDAEAHFRLGFVYSKKGMYHETIIHYKKAIEINPDLAEAHLNLGIAYYVKGKYSLAIEHCDEAIALGLRVHSEFLEALEQYQEK